MMGWSAHSLKESGEVIYLGGAPEGRGRTVAHVAAAVERQESREWAVEHQQLLEMGQLR